MGILSIFADNTAKEYVVLTTLNAVLQKVPCSSVVKSYGFKAVVGRNINESNLREFLVRMGFTKSSTVREAGEYAIRGGIIDIFPPRRRRSHPNRIAMLKALNINDDNIAFNSSLKLSNFGLDLHKFSINRNLTDNQIKQIIKKNEAIIIDSTQSKTAFHKIIWQQLKNDTLAALDIYHTKNNEILGPSIDQLHKSLVNNIPQNTFCLLYTSPSPRDS